MIAVNSASVTVGCAVAIFVFFACTPACLFSRPFSRPKLLCTFVPFEKKAAARFMRATAAWCFLLLYQKKKKLCHCPVKPYVFLFMLLTGTMYAISPGLSNPTTKLKPYARICTHQRTASAHVSTGTRHTRPTTEEPLLCRAPWATAAKVSCVWLYKRAVGCNESLPTHYRASRAPYCVRFHTLNSNKRLW